jgi:hypothetical protein
VTVDERVVTREIGSPKAMASQLRHLADIAARPNIIIQGIPLKPGRTSG